MFYQEFDLGFGTGGRTVVSSLYVVALGGLRKAARSSLQAGQVIQAFKVHSPPRPLDDFDTGADGMRLSPTDGEDL